MLERSLFRGLDHVRRAPDIRHDRVEDMRRRIASDLWNPANGSVAEKILYEHLFDSPVL